MRRSYYINGIFLYFITPNKIYLDLNDVFHKMTIKITSIVDYDSLENSKKIQKVSELLTYYCSSSIQTPQST